MFEIETGAIDRGASLDWVSQYPSEAEHVILPLSSFEVVGMRQETKAKVLEQTQVGARICPASTFPSAPPLTVA